MYVLHYFTFDVLICNVLLTSSWIGHSSHSNSGELWCGKRYWHTHTQDW